MISDEVKAALDAELDPARVKHRDAGRGRQVGYLEGWDVINAANRIFGYDGWSYRVLSTGIAHSGTDREGREVALFEATVEVTALGVTRTDIGTSATADDTLGAADTALKGAVTDGMKRALRTFGAQFGNDLYDKDAPQQTASSAPRRQQSRPANGSAMVTVGDLLSWAYQERKMPRPQVLKLLEVSDPKEITDFEDAKVRIIAATGGA